MSEIVFAREPLAAMLDSGLEALLRAHWKEVALDQDVIAYNPDWDEYLACEARRSFVAWSLRKDGELIGYNAFFVIRAMHYKDHAFAMNDVIYLKPDERGVEGLAMILLTERDLRDMGVSKAFYHVKTAVMLGTDEGDSLDALEQLQELEERLNMKLPEAIYSTDHTLGGVLAALGYGHGENHFGKLLRERTT